MPRRLLRTASGALALLVLGALFVYLSEPVFWRRLVTFPGSDAITAVDWYQPLEEVPGEERAELVMAGPEKRRISQAALSEVLAYGSKTGSVALLVWHDGALQLEHYWPGYDRNTRTDSSSLHKTVLGLLYGAAISDGVIRSPDEPAASYLPEWRGDARAKIRIRDLLQMSSGLEVVAFSANPFTRWWQLLLGEDVTSVSLSVPAVRAPGEQFEYSNFNSQALGVALQRASGKRYAQYLSERLWSRLGAGSASVWLDHEGGMARTYCCLQTTARGWLSVGRLILDQGRVGHEQVVPASWIARMTTPAPANRNYGLHLWLSSPAGATRGYNSRSRFRARHSEPFAAADVVFLDGNGGQRVYVIPSAQLVIVRTGAAGADWDDARLPNAILRGIVRAGAPPPAEAGSGAGR